MPVLQQDTDDPVDGAKVIGSVPERPAAAALELRTHKRAVYERLRGMIVSLELAPGDRLVENELAAQLGVSKTPVREALALLEADSLVETTPYRGAMVRWLSVNEMREQGFLVDALEVPAYPMVVERITRREIASVGRITERLRQARRDRDGKRFGELAVEIHTELFRCTGFPRLQKLIRIVLGPVGLRYDKVLVYPFDDAWDVLLELSVARYEAIRDGDADRAAQDIRRLRDVLLAKNLERVTLPEMARFFREP